VAILERLKHVGAAGSPIARAWDTLRRNGVRGLARAVVRHGAGRVGIRLPNPDDHHIFHFSYEELLQVLSAAGFRPEKIHWQKPPFAFCVYLSASPGKARARQPEPAAGRAGHATGTRTSA
jgi:hypothetical protein